MFQVVYFENPVALLVIKEQKNGHQDVFFPALAGPGRCWGDDGNQVRRSNCWIGRVVNHRIRGGQHETENGMPVEMKGTDLPSCQWSFLVPLIGGR